MSAHYTRRKSLTVESLEARDVPAGLPPTALEQLMLEQLNDIRANPPAYGAFIGLNLNAVTPAPPLAFDTRLVEAARAHSRDMNDRAYFAHNTSEGVTPGQRLTRAGFNWTSFGESTVAGSANPTPAEALRALIIDQGVPELTHRKHLLGLEAVFRGQGQIGIGIVQGGGGPLTNYYTLDTAAGADGRPFLTGVVFNDANFNSAYDPGEGLGGVTVTAAGAGSVTTFDSGGYSLQVNPGTYTVTASGGALAAAVSQTVRVEQTNLRLNFPVNPALDRSTTTAWVSLLYRDLLGRTGSVDEVNGWTNFFLGNGTAQGRVVLAFVHSEEYAVRRVTEWFRTYLGREPDEGGLQHFVRQLRQETPEKVVRASILISAEYFQKNGGTAEGLVRGLYRDLLGRTPNGAEANAWVQQVRDGGGAQVVLGIQSSAEYANRVAAEQFKRLRRAVPDNTSLLNLANQILRGGDEVGVVHQIASGVEYYNDAHEIVWLRGLYQDLLGRDGDNVNELGAWLFHLNGGVKRDQLAAAFLNTREALGRLVAPWYRSLLGREPDAGGLANFVAQLQSGKRLADVVVGVGASQEYFLNHGSNNEQFVRGLYRDLLGRPASDAEAAAWVDFLKGSNRTRGQVVLAFSASREFQRNFIRDTVARLLRRQARQAELDDYLGKLQGGASEAVVLQAVLGSPEYYAYYGV